MATISLCMIVRNEENVLARCLSSVGPIADEIIIVDTGSTDKTKTIARQFTDKIFDFEWIDDFSAARNYAFEQAAMDFQLWLDADDVILPEDQEKLLALKEELTTDTDLVVIKYNTHFGADGQPIFSSMRERLFNRERGYRWQDPIHEFIPLNGNIRQAGHIAITHKKEKEYTDRNILIYQALEKKGAKFSPRQLYYFARELRDHQQYHKAITYFSRFLDTGQGWFEDNINACFSLAQCYSAVGYDENVLPVLFHSFSYAAPRAEVCCGIGYYYKQKNNYALATEWFKTAYCLEKPDTYCFLLNDYWDYIPAIELCVCYYHLGNIEAAEKYNEEAAKIKPDSQAVQENIAFFKSL